tara:strand:+ start:101356 stop:102582 length:1227 start_codon:yes stop_codon:yes gene_type:complete
MKLFLLFSFLLSSQILRADPEDLSTCDTWSPQDFDIYIDKTLLRFPESTKNVKDNIDYMQRLCGDRIKSLGIEACLKRSEGYYSQFFYQYQIENTLSSVKTNSQYLADQPQEKMKLPDQLFTKDLTLKRNWKAIAKENGWQWIHFQSNTTVGGRPSARLIFVIPKDGYQQNILVATFSDEDGNNSNPTEYRSIQMQTIEFESEGETLEKPLLHFRGWYKNKGIGNASLNNIHKGQRCVGCHASGPRKVVLMDNPAFPTTFSDETSLKKINEAITIDKLHDMSLYYDLENFPTDLKIGEGKGAECISCHNNEKQRSLAFSRTIDGSFWTNDWDRKIFTEKSMPADDVIYNYTDEERIHIRMSLIPEYSRKLKAWLTETKCEKPPETHSDSSSTSSKVQPKPSTPGDSAR